MKLHMPDRPKTVAGKTRSPHWPATEKAWLKEHGECAVCGGTKKLQVHHKKPYHEFPELELDRTNFMTLCMASGYFCHFVFGHLFNWKYFNPVVEAMAKMMRKLTRAARQ